MFVQAFTVTARGKTCIYKTIALMSMRSMVKGHGELKTAVCAAREVGRMFWQVGQFAIHLSNVRQKNMAFSTAADLCHTLLGRCSCLQMRSTHTHTHAHTHTNSWQVVAVSLAGHLLVLQSSWSDMISAFQRCRMPPTFFHSASIFWFKMSWLANCSI